MGLVVVLLVVAGSAIVIAFVILVSAALVRRAEVRRVHAEARVAQLTNLLDTSDASRAAERRLFEAQVTAWYSTTEQTLAIYRETIATLGARIANLSRRVTGDEDADASPPRNTKPSTH